MRLTGIEKEDDHADRRPRSGTQCREFLDDSLANLSLRSRPVRRDLDLCRHERGARRSGTWTRDRTSATVPFTALDTDTKLLVTFAVGKRNCGNDASLHRGPREAVGPPAELLGRRIGRRSEHRRLGSLRAAIPDHFGGTVKHGVLIKNYVNPEVGRYAPPALVKADRYQRQRDKRSRDDMHLARRAEQSDDPHVYADGSLGWRWASQRRSRTWPPRPRSTLRFTTSAAFTARFDARPRWPPA